MKHVLRCYGEIYDVEIERAEGCHIYDVAGRRYTDFEAGVWSASLGHTHPDVTRAICEQAGSIMHLGYRYEHRVVEEAARAVLELCGHADGKAIFLSSGSEAVEFAVQMARRVSGKTKLLCLKGTYLAAFGSAGSRSDGNWHEVDWSPCVGCSRHCEDDCPVLREVPVTQIGGLVFEAGSSQVRMPPVKVISYLAEMVRQQGGLLVANEITTGFGRTGKWFGYEHYGLSPDLIALGKGMGNGYPVSAVAISASAASAIEASGVRYAQSHQNDALGCAVLLAVIKAMKEGGLVARSQSAGHYLQQSLERLVTESSLLTECRGTGLMLMLQFGPDVASDYVAGLHRRLFQAGFLVGYSPALHAFRLFPPLMVTTADCDSLVTTLCHELAN